MLALLLAHLLAGVCAPALVRVLDRRAFLPLALVPAASAVWVAAAWPSVTGPGAQPLREQLAWAPAIGLGIDLELTALRAVLALVVSGIGALVLVYSAWYFRAGDRELWRFSAVLVLFAGAMLGLVLADNLLLLYVFWEATSVLSYLLIGHNPERQANRSAAMTALLVTTLGGLAMLVGLVLLGEAAGTYRVSGVLAAPPTGTAVAVGALLVLVGAVTKSALVPFHYWLPGAMAAPTPVSAFLHAASMVKAGIFLVALLAPALAGSPGWRPALITLGLLTMLHGGVRALRQHDIKLLLAYGTVSQLGLMMLLLGAGTRRLALAGIGVLVAHALFKAALFLVVGVVNRATGTRDLRELSGLARRLPVTATAAALAALSMAGVPPTFGFIAKEAALDAALHSQVDWLPGWALLLGLAVGSVLTVAYSARFVWGTFGTRPGLSDTPVIDSPAALFVMPPVVLALAGVVMAALAGPLTTAMAPYLGALPGSEAAPGLALWHGLTPALGTSAAVLLLGTALFVRSGRQLRWTGRALLPDAATTHRRAMRLLDRLAVETTGATQRGSLPFYLSTILLVWAVGAAVALSRVDVEAGVHLADSPAQALIALVVIAATVVTVRSRRRLRAVLVAGSPAMARRCSSRSTAHPTWR
ncbi:proton-conducting transporter membrane subunit [Actinomycetota bacterium]